MWPCRSFTVGTEARRRCKNVSTKKISSRKVDESSQLVTSQSGYLSRLIVDFQLGSGKSLEAGRVGLKKFLEDLASLFNDDLGRRMRLAPKAHKSKEDPNRLQAIGPNLGDYTQWVRLRAPTVSKVSRLEEGKKKEKA